MPDIDPSLSDTWECFTLCETQLRVGFGGAYALDWSVVANVAAALGIIPDGPFYVLLRIFEATMFSARKEE